jgi:NAD(P)H-hydrate epimerase
MVVQRYNFLMENCQPTGAERRLYTAAQVRELDRSAIEGHGIAGRDLMERAGTATFNAIRKQFPDCRRWLIVCGSGNNGGDGYIIARLAREEGLDCRVAALKAPESLHGDAASAAQGWLESGGTVESGPPRSVDGSDLLVDALLGTGLDRAAEGDYADAIASLNSCGSITVAVDIPSGLNSDTGCALGGLAVRADMTVTFIGRKRGLFTADGPDYAGLLVYHSLDVPESVFDQNFISGELIPEQMIGECLPRRSRNSHKGDYGWLLGVGGDIGMGGALRLCGQAALRSGGGKVTLLTHPLHAAMLDVGCPELMVRGVAKAHEVNTFLGGVDVVALGTGLGQSKWSRTILNACKGFKGPLVMDADALNLLAAESAFDSIQEDNKEFIITPHPAEAGRLLGTNSKDVQGDRVAAACELAKIGGCVVVLKGCGTVVAEPGGHYAICALGNPGMASGGTGDVLTGVIGAMLAQGLSGWTAARVGVVAHAAAADVAATKLGERGLIASDIIDCLPLVLNPQRQACPDS